MHAPARSPFLNPCAFFFAALVGLAAWCVAGGLAPALTESSRAAIRGSVVVITGASSGIGAELAVQYGALGALGALTGMVLAFAGAWGLTRFVFKDPFNPAVGPTVVIAVGMLLLTMAIGLLTSRDVYKETPMAAIREA